QAEDGIRYGHVTGVQTCALPISWPFFSKFNSVATTLPLHSTGGFNGELLGHDCLSVRCAVTVTSHMPAEPRSPLPSYIPSPLSAPLITVFISGMFIAGIAAIKKVAVTCAPAIGLPAGSVNLTRIVLLPFCAGEGSVVNSTLAFASVPGGLSCAFATEL